MSQSSEDYRALFDEAPDALVVVDLEGRVLDMNTAAERLVGRGRHELVGRSIVDLLLAEDVMRRPPQWQALLEGRDVISERLFRRHDGGTVLVEVHSRRLPGTDRALLVARDLGSRAPGDQAIGAVVRALSSLTGEACLRALTEQLCQLLDVDFALVGEPSAEDPDTVQVLAASRRGEPLAPLRYRLTGSPCGDVAARGLCVHAARVRESFPGDALLGELGIEGYAGTDLRGSDGRFLGILAVMTRGAFHDLAVVEAAIRALGVRAGAELERRRNELLVRSSEARLRAIASALPDRIFAVGDDGRILELWSGSSESEPVLRPADVGRTLEEVLPEALAAHYRELVRAALADGETAPREFQVPIDGRTVWLETRAARIGLQLEGRAAAVLMARDVTERKSTEVALTLLQDQFLQAQKMEAVGRLAGGVAHDFNNLLGIIQGYSQLIREELPIDHPQREDLAEIERAAERGSAVTRRLLAFSRKDVGEPQSVRLPALLSDLRKLLARLMGEDVSVSFETRGEPGPVFVDPAQVEQVILNLAVNARDAMPEGGRLDLAIEEVTIVDGDPDPPAGRWVRLTVADDGAGMDAETQRRMFEPFFTTKQLGKGTGLGLATVYGIVQQARGHIRCQSELGVGTTFSIYLPVHTTEAPAARPAEAAGTRPFSPGENTILLVEDEPSLRSVERRWLEAVGFHVLAAGSIAEATAIASEHPAPVHLLLTDVVLPDGNGHRLAENLQKARPELRVLFVSGYAAEHLDRSGGFPADEGFLPKPYSMRTLLEVVRRRLGAA